MGLIDAKFKIEEDNYCPLYNEGDAFRLTGNGLVLPPGKSACLILMEDIRHVLIRLKNLGETAAPGYRFYCSGCTGLIKLVKVEEGQLPRLPAGKKKADETPSIVSVLGNFSIFQNIDQESIKNIIMMLKLQKIQPGDIIIRKGSPGENLYIIVSGRVEVLGDEGIRIAILEQGEVFGEMSLLSGDPVGATIRAMDACKILYLNAKDFRNLLTRYPSMQMYFARLLARRLANTNIVRAEDFASGMIGKLTDIPPSELFQTMNANQKSGILRLDLPMGDATVSFRDGELVKAEYNGKSGKQAFFSILKETEGRFKFDQGLPDDQMNLEELGEFMWLLMEGVRIMDEEAEDTQTGFLD